ncbi:sensor histidine kinase [Anoxybacteroides tepidamans]|uniref:sensor histidine kinase n=1 Tax=Anoxybacteroides tepidamans TaxID=265948 RepID=UPI000686C0E7|nr:ATP-binding protein [Anoxybacillus tepidamans]
MMNRLAFFRKTKNADMFYLAQWRLTALYSGIFILFLTVFIVIVCSLLYMIVSNDQERRISGLADQEKKAIEQFLVKQTDFDFLDNENVLFLSEDQFFFYVVDTNGQLLMGDEVNKEMQPLLLEALSRSAPRVNEQKYMEVQLPSQWHKFARFHSHELKLLTTARPVSIHNHLIGTLYVGMDVTSFSGVFKWLGIVLVGIAILFIGVAVLLSYFMSRRTLVPIREAYDRQRQFVADASHELRTPLSVIFSSVEALGMEEELKKNEFIQKLLHRLREEIQRMTKLMNDLLTLARADSGRAALELAKERFDFRVPAERTLELLTDVAAKKGIELHFQAPEAAVVFGDADKLTQLLYILLDNAIKYTPSGGRVTLTLRNDFFKQQRRLVISVKDTGIGIPPEDIGRIFDRFYRVDKARSRQQGGHGLGLSIAKWIVDAHGGTIHVQSEVGKGTEFIVNIPFSDAFH